MNATKRTKRISFLKKKERKKERTKKQVITTITLFFTYQVQQRVEEKPEFITAIGRVGTQWLALVLN